jgi:hypothetical protein
LRIGTASASLGDGTVVSGAGEVDHLTECAFMDVAGVHTVERTRAAVRNGDGR